MSQCTESEWFRTEWKCSTNSDCSGWSDYENEDITSLHKYWRCKNLPNLFHLKSPHSSITSRVSSVWLEVHNFMPLDCALKFYVQFSLFCCSSNKSPIRYRRGDLVKRKINRKEKASNTASDREQPELRHQHSSRLRDYTLVHMFCSFHSDRVRWVGLWTTANRVINHVHVLFMQILVKLHEANNSSWFDFEFQSNHEVQSGMRSLLSSAVIKCSSRCHSASQWATPPEISLTEESSKQ